MYRSNYRDQSDKDFADMYYVDYPIGYRRGPDALDLWLTASWQYGLNLIELELAYLQQGDKELYDTYESAMEAEEVLSGIVETQWLMNLLYNRQIFSFLNIYLGGGKLDIPEQRNYSLLGERLRRRRAAFTLEYSSEKSDSLNALSCGRTERYKISFKRDALLMAEGEPFRLAVKRMGKHNESLGIDDRKYKRLIQGEYSPDAFILFI